MYTITRITYNTASGKKSVAVNEQVDNLEEYRKYLHSIVKSKSILLTYEKR